MKKLFLVGLMAIIHSTFAIGTNETFYNSIEFGDITGSTPMYDAETIDNIAFDKADITNVIFKADLQAALENNKTDKAETVFGSIDMANNTWNALNELVGNEDQQVIPEEHSFTRAIYSDNTTNDYEIVGILNDGDIIKEDLVSIEIGNTVTSIGGRAFYNCSSLMSVTIPDSVRSIGDNVFSGCSGLKSVTIPDSVTSIGASAFSGCSNLMSATIGNSVTNIKSYTFQYCTNLTSVTIPDSVMSIGSYAFRGCSGLTSVTIPDSVTSIGGGAFSFASSNLEGVYITDLASWCNINFGTGDANPLHDGASLYVNGNKITEILTIPNTVTQIKQYAFTGLTQHSGEITKIIIPNSVTNIANYAFEYCTNITILAIGNGLINIEENAFANGALTNLQTIYYTRSQDQTQEEAIQNLKTKLANFGLDLDRIKFIDITLNPEKLGDFDPNKTIYSSEQVDTLLENYLPLTGGTITGSLAQGALVEATGQYSHAEGMMATASGNYSHAEGWYTKAIGDISHAAGVSAKANDTLSYVWSGEQFTDVDEYCFDVANETIINPFEDFDNKVPIPMTINGMLGTETNLWTDWTIQIDLYDNDFEEGNFIEIEYDANNTNWICRIDEEVLDVTDRPCTAEFFNHDFKFVYVGENEPNEFEICQNYGKEFYESHGEGTYNIDPVGGLNGFYVGDSSLGSTLSGYAKLTELYKYLPLTGGILTGNLTISPPSGTPTLILQRGTATDNETNWQLYNMGTNLAFQSKTTGNWTTRASMYNSGGFSHGSDCHATGSFSTANGEHSRALELNAYASGYYAIASGYASRATGGRTEATGTYSEAHGRYAKSTNDLAWVWNSYDNASGYGSHGSGTFNINPTNGTDGLYIGETNLTDHIKNISSNNLPIATTDSLGVVKVGDNLNIAADGTLSVPITKETWTFTLTNGSNVTKKIAIYD